MHLSSSVIDLWTIFYLSRMYEYCKYVVWRNWTHVNTCDNYVICHQLNQHAGIISHKPPKNICPWNTRAGSFPWIRCWLYSSASPGKIGSLAAKTMTPLEWHVILCFALTFKLPARGETFSHCPFQGWTCPTFTLPLCLMHMCIVSTNHQLKHIAKSRKGERPGWSSESNSDAKASENSWSNCLTAGNSNDTTWIIFAAVQLINLSSSLDYLLRWKGSNSWNWHAKSGWPKYSKSRNQCRIEFCLCCILLVMWRWPQKFFIFGGLDLAPAFGCFKARGVFSSWSGSFWCLFFLGRQFTQKYGRLRIYEDVNDTWFIITIYIYDILYIISLIFVHLQKMECQKAHCTLALLRWSTVSSGRTDLYQNSQVFFIVFWITAGGSGFWRLPVIPAWKHPACVKQQLPSSKDWYCMIWNYIHGISSLPQIWANRCDKHPVSWDWKIRCIQIAMLLRVPGNSWENLGTMATDGPTGPS